MKPWYCYILRNTNVKHKNLTYNGSTNDPVRRLRQHNKEIKGGAKYTTSKSSSWEIYALMTGFVSHKNALSCEWKIKHPTGKRFRPKKFCGVAGRIEALNDILWLDKWTSKCDIKNSECEYTLYLVEDMINSLDIYNIPSNVVVKIVKRIIPKDIHNKKIDV
jgi:predicted GIY-YIG superfamily endonuclease